MKNLVFNLRTAKAQAEGCVKVTKSSRMAKILTTLTLLLTLGVGQMWAKQMCDLVSSGNVNRAMPNYEAGYNMGTINVWFSINGASYSSKGSTSSNIGTDRDISASKITSGLKFNKFSVPVYCHNQWHGDACSNNGARIVDKSLVMSWKVSNPSGTQVGSGNFTTTTNVSLSWSGNGATGTWTSNTSEQNLLSGVSASTSADQTYTLDFWYKFQCHMYNSSGSDWGSNVNVWYPGGEDHFKYQFKIPQTTLTVNSSGDDGSASVSSGISNSITYNTNYSLSASDVTGYDFVNWTTSSGSISITSPTSRTGAQVKFTSFTSATITANYTPHTYSITYNNMTGATNHASNPSTYTIESENITLYAPTKTGYLFGGWYTNAELTTPVTAIAAGSHENKVFYAKWTAITISEVSASPSSGSTGVQTMTVSFKTNVPRNSGYYYRIAEFGGANAGTTGGGFHSNGNLISSGDASTLITSGSFSTINFTSTGVYTSAIEIYTDGPFTVQKRVTFTYGAGNYYTVSFDLQGHGSSISSQSILSGGKATAPSPAPTATGYTFGGWYKEPACTNAWNFSTETVTSDKTLYAKWTANVYRITLNDNSGEGGDGYKDVTYAAVLPAVTNAPTRTGYTFDGYWDGAGGTGTQVFGSNRAPKASAGSYTDGSVNWIYADDVTLYAKWNEKMSTLTTSCHYDAGDPSYAVPTKSVSSIGISTTSNLVATAPGTGYTFVGWTLTHCVRTSGAANSRTITVRSDGSGEAASAVANYEEVLTSTYYVEGNASGPFTYGWNANANTMMMKRTGYSTSSDVYWELEVSASKTSPADNQWEFKIYNDASTTGEKWYGWGNGTNHHWLTKANNNLTLSTTGSNTIYLKCYVEGTYTFHVNYSTPASPTLEVIWPVVNQLRISSASPTDATNTNNFDLTDKGSNNWEVKRTLNANTTYTFKMVFDGAWYGDGTAFTRSNTSATGLTDGDNMTIKTDVAGEYTFTFNSSSKNLDITYPTAYTVTYGVGTSYTSMGSVSTSPSVTSGNYVIAGTSIRFTATPNLGYKFVGWYREAACTNQVSTSNPYDLTINATTKLYAKFEVRNLYIHADWLSWGTAQMTQSTVNRAVYTYEIDNVAAAATSASSPYNNGYHFRFMNANNAGDDYLAYNYNGVQTPTGSGFLTNSDIHKTADGNPTIQYNLTHKSHITITLTLRSIDDATKPTVNIAADPYYTISTAKAGTGTAGVSISPSSVEARSGANSPTIAATISPGYSFVNWTATSGITINSSGSTSTTVRATTSGTLTANVNANTYDINLNANGGSGAAKVVTVTYAAGMPSKLKSGADLTAHSRTGYNFAGYYDHTSTGTQYYTSTLESARNWDKTTAAPLYAHWTAKTYTITLTQSGETGYGSSGTASVTATYDAALPTIASLPTAAQGYAFMGYYTGHNGTGTQYYGPTGNKLVATYTTAGGIELFAYFKKAEITDITLDNYMFDPVAAGGTGFIIANPTVEPTPVLPVKICWELLYDNGNSVPAGHEAIDDHDGSHPNRVKFSIAGLAAGGYKIKATLRTGDDCSGGTLLSEREVSFTIASGYTVTIQYKDSEGNTIAPSTTSPGKATDWTSISAPTIVGYNFSTWVPGDGITLESSATTNNNRFKATFNGTLTARYTKKRVIYFNNTLGWSNVYVYFYSSNKYWADNYGTGAYAGKYFDGYKPYSDQRHGHMTQIEGTNIWYFDYTAAGYDTYENIAFANMDKSNSGTDNTSNNDLGFFSNTPSDPIQVVRRGDHNASLPMFVPLAGQPKTKLNNNKAEYSNQGYWMNYPENTGYALRLFNSSGVEIDSIPFEFTPDKTMPMSVEYILDGSKTYQFKLYRTDGKWFGNNGTMKAGASGDIGETSWEFKEKDGETTRNNCQIKTNAAGTYTFTLDFGNKDGYNYLIGVHYPAAANDFQILYNDNAEWSLGSAHDANWVHPSRIIRARENGVDTISFFVAKDNTPILKARKVSSINASGAITWGSLNISGAAKQDLTVDSSAVYNFKVTQGAAGVINSIQYIGAYTGNYYIRSSALSNKWGNYVDNLDHRMTYSSFSESNANSFGEKYSHYKAKWCPRNTNIAFCIANDYSPCITDTLKQDVGNPYNNTDTEGTLKNDGDAGHSGNNAYLDRYSANVRFMWDRKTNKISRAYISAATSGLAQFLVLRAGQELHNENNVAISSSPANSVLLSDNENWIYEARLMIKPGTRFKLYACYAKSPVDPASAQYFRGAYDSDNFTSDDNSVILIGGESVDYQLARIVYDFKTNRLIAAWMPSGEVSGTNEINADIMVIRDHQESARCITFRDASANLSKVKTVYGVMRFNRWILNNRQHPEDQDKEHARPDHIVEDLRDHHAPLPVGQQKSTYERRLYFISFPFDVLVGDIFGFGTYGQYWVIQYYDGLNRAKKGYWMDSKPNWKYVSPTEVAQGYKLEKNQGYILELNLSAMAADNTTFWSNGISTIELYFPSTVNQETLKQTNCTIPALSDEYECKINRGTTEGDRRVKDSYWRCIGVPSYNLYNSTLKDGSGNAITWKTDYTWYNDEREFPFIYMWNKTDNTLTPQATSTFTFQPMHAYLTQIKNAIVWTAVSAKPSSIVARRASKEATKEYNWRIELKQDTTFLDQTYVRMTDLEQVTDSFDFGQDLIKELNSRSNIYTFIGYEKVAANSMTLHTDQTTVIPVGANITTEGEYTFALPDGADGIGVTLIDEETGVRTNLSAGMDYTVNLEKGTHDNRFWLEISPVQQTPTDIEAVSDQPSEVRKVLIDGILYIVKDGKLFDARGARVE